MTSELPNSISPAEACRRLGGISRSTLDRLSAQGRLEKIRVSDGRVGITVESIERHLARLNGDWGAQADHRPGSAFPLFLDEDFPEAA